MHHFHILNFTNFILFHLKLFKPKKNKVHKVRTLDNYAGGCSFVLKDDMSSPGRKYAGTTKSAFFPLSTEGIRVVDLLQKAFSARCLFTIKPSSDASTADELVWNGVCHKTNVFGGPQQCVVLFSVAYLEPLKSALLLLLFLLFTFLLVKSSQVDFDTNSWQSRKFTM